MQRLLSISLARYHLPYKRRFEAQQERNENVPRRLARESNQPGPAAKRRRHIGLSARLGGTGQAPGGKDWAPGVKELLAPLPRHLSSERFPVPGCCGTRRCHPFAVLADLLKRLRPCIGWLCRLAARCRGRTC